MLPLYRNTLVAVLLLVCAGLAIAQRGVGEDRGLAQRADKPPLVQLEGKVVDIASHPCPHTTGRSNLGTHLHLDTGEVTRNIHLGPTAEVEPLIDGLKIGTRLHVEGFRTDRMPEQHYVARTLSWAGRTITLREPSLRPIWAGSRRNPRGRGAGPDQTVSPEQLHALRGQLEHMKQAEGDEKVEAMADLLETLTQQHLQVMPRRGPATKPAPRWRQRRSRPQQQHRGQGRGPPDQRPQP